MKKNIALLKMILENIKEAELDTPIGKVDTDIFKGKLSAVDPAKAKAAVKAGKKDGSEKDDKAIASKITKNFSVAASSLKPGQTEVIPEKAAAIAIGMLNSGKVGGPLGAIISGDMHIMDGHHRWAATVLVNPGASVSGLKIDVPGEALVGILNVYTKGALGRQKGNPGKGNVKEFTKDKIAAVLDGYMKNGCKIGVVDDKGGYSEKDIDGEEVKKILGKMKGANGDANKGKDLMSSNADKLNKQIPSWAPPRVDMPVINSDELNALVKKLESGEFDIVAPYSKDVKNAKAPEGGEEEKTDVKEFRQSLQEVLRMKKLAGINKK